MVDTSDCGSNLGMVEVGSFKQMLDMGRHLAGQGRSFFAHGKPPLLRVAKSPHKSALQFRETFLRILSATD